MSRCIHCRETLTRDLIAIGVKTCGRCAVLLQQLGDTVVEPPPAREPGCDDERSLFTPETVTSDGRDFKAHAEAAKALTRRDGRWLAWAAAKRGETRFFHDYGHTCGYPRDIRQWSPVMVEKAIQAIQSKKAKV